MNWADESKSVLGWSEGQPVHGDGAQGRDRTTDTAIFSFRGGHSGSFWRVLSMAHATWLPRNAEFREVHSILGHSGLSYTGIAYVALMTGFDPLRTLAGGVMKCHDW